MVNDAVAPHRLTAPRLARVELRVGYTGRPLEEQLHRRAILRSNRAWLKSIADHQATQEHGDD
jgi:hypothetical protein